VQDVVLSDGAAEHMLKTADFVDDLLAQYYGLEPFYDLDDREELVGELVFGMAPPPPARRQLGELSDLRQQQSGTLTLFPRR